MLIFKILYKKSYCIPAELPRRSDPDPSVPSHSLSLSQLKLVYDWSISWLKTTRANEDEEARFSYSHTLRLRSFLLSSGLSHSLHSTQTLTKPQQSNPKNTKLSVTVLFCFMCCQLEFLLYVNSVFSFIGFSSWSYMPIFELVMP